MSGALITKDIALLSRRTLGYRQHEVSALIGTTRNTYSLWERGNRHLPLGSHIALSILLRPLNTPAEIVFDALSGAAK